MEYFQVLFGNAKAQMPLCLQAVEKKGEVVCLTKVKLMSRLYEITLISRLHQRYKFGYFLDNVINIIF